jgi:hypothetical protein
MSSIMRRRKGLIVGVETVSFGALGNALGSE